MVENVKDLEMRLKQCIGDRNKRKIYFENDAENFLIIGKKDIKQLFTILSIEICDNIEYNFNNISVDQYKSSELILFGDNKISTTKDEVLDREILVILSLLYEQVQSDKKNKKDKK